MNNNFFFSIIFCCCSFLLSAQEYKDIEIEYEQINNTEANNTFYNMYKAMLYIQDGVSIFQEKTSTTTYSDTGNDSGTAIVVRPTVTFEPYIKIDRNSKELLFFEMIGANIFIVKDNYNELKWDITPDTKDVAGYKCTKATTTFRGRTWIAWFTPQIPVPFGPWKLHGLPGLILEASEFSNRYIYKAIAIKFSKGNVFSTNFSKLMKAYNNQPITYKQFLTDKDEYLDNAYKKMSQETNSEVSRQKFPPNGLELKYEWDK